MHEHCGQLWKWENAGPTYLLAMDVLHQVGLCLSMLACMIACCTLAKLLVDICMRPACISIVACWQGSRRGSHPLTYWQLAYKSPCHNS